MQQGASEMHVMCPVTKKNRRPAEFQRVPKDTTAAPKLTEQLNLKCSKDSRYELNEYLQHLQKISRPAYTYEVIDALLKGLAEPKFRGQVTEMLRSRTRERARIAMEEA